jgi:hypothetical protein
MNQYETYYKKKLEALNREIAIGLEQANKGECVEFDFDELMQEVDEELGLHQRQVMKKFSITTKADADLRDISRRHRNH